MMISKQASSTSELCLGWNVRSIAQVGQWVTNKTPSAHFITVSVSFEEQISKNVISKMQLGQWSPPMVYKLVLGPIPIVHIQTFKRIREQLWAFPDILK